MDLFDSHGEAPHPLQQQLIFDTSQAREEIKAFAEVAVKSLKEAEDETRKLASELEALVVARKKFDTEPNRQRAQVVTPEGDVRTLTKVKLEQQIKAVNEQYQKSLKLAQDLAREEYEVGQAVEKARKANQLFTKDLEKNPQHIVKIKNAYAELERQIQRLSNIQVKSPTQQKYLNDLNNQYKLSGDQIEHLLDLEHRYSKAIADGAEAERKRTAQALATYEAEKKAAAEAAKSARALNAIQSNPQIRPTKAFSSQADRDLRESGLRAAFNSKAFEQSLIRQNVESNVATNQRAVAASKFNLNELEKQVQKNIELRQKEADAVAKIAQKQAVAEVKAAEDAKKAQAKAAQEAQKQLEAQAKEAEKALKEQQKQLEALAKAEADAAKQGDYLLSVFEELHKKTEVKSNNTVGLQTPKYQVPNDEYKQLAEDAKLAEKAVKDQAKAQAEAAKAAKAAQRALANRPAELDKEISSLTTQYLRAQKAAEALEKANKGISSEAIKDAKQAVENYRVKLEAALKEAKNLGSQTANMARAQAALTGAFEKTKSGLHDFLDIGSKASLVLYGIQTAIQDLLVPFQLLKQVFIDTNKEMDDLSLGFASTFNNIFNESFSKSVQRASSFVKQLREEATHSILTFEELTQVAQTVLPQVLARKGGTPEAALTISKFFGEEQKILFGADKFDPGRVRDEVSAFLSGQVKSRSNETLLALGITKEDLQNAKTMDERIQLLKDHTQGLKAASDEFSSHFSGSLKDLTNQLFILETEIGKPLFAEVTKSLIQFNKELERGDFNPLVQAIKDLVNALAELIRLSRDFNTLVKGNPVLSGIFGTVDFINSHGGNLISSFVHSAHKFSVQAQRQSRDSNVDSFIQDYKDDRKVLNQALYEVRKEQQDILKDKGLLGTGLFAPDQKEINKRLAAKNYQETKLMEALGFGDVKPSDSERRNNPGDLNNGNAVIAPKSLVQGLPTLSQIDQISKHYSEAIRNINSSNKELQASLDAIDPGGLVGIVKEIDSIREKISVNSSARDSVLRMIEALTSQKSNLQSEFKTAQAVALANPKDKEAVQQALILKDEFTKVQSQLEKALSEKEKLDDQFNEFQADLITTETRKFEATQQNRKDLNALKTDILDLQTTLSNDVFKNPFAGLSTANEQVQIKNLTEDIVRLSQTIEGVSQIGNFRPGENGKTLGDLLPNLNNFLRLSQGEMASRIGELFPAIQGDFNSLNIKDFNSLDSETQASLESLRKAIPQLFASRLQERSSVNGQALSRLGQFQSSAQDLIARNQGRIDLTQQQKDSFALAVNERAQSVINEVLETGFFGNKDLRVDGQIPPETKRQLENLQNAFTQATLDIKRAYTVNIVEAGKQAFDSFFDSVLNGTASFKEAFINFFKDIGTQIERIFSSRIADKLDQMLFGGTGGIQVGMPESGQASIPSGQKGLSAFMALASPFIGRVSKTQNATGAAGSILNSTGALLPEVQLGPAVTSDVVKQGFMDAYDDMLKPGGSLSKLATTTAGSSINSASGASLLGAKAFSVLIPIAGAAGSFMAGRSAGKSLGAGKGALAGLGSGALIGGIAGSIFGPAGTIVGASLGGTLGGIGGLVGANSKSARQSKRQDYQDNVLSPALDAIISSADPYDINSLVAAKLQAARGVKGNGERGMELKQQAMAKIQAMIDDLEKQIEEALKLLNEQIEELTRSPNQRGIVPNIKQTLENFQQQLKIGVNPQKIFEAFNLQIRDSLATLELQLDAAYEQINQGAEDDKGNLISLAQGLQEQVSEIQKNAQSSLENLRRDFASQASAIIGEGRASAITPSAANRQQKLAILSQQERKQESDLQTQTTNSILRATNETNRQIADLQKQANDTLDQIALLLSSAIGLAPGSLQGFDTSFLQALQSFVNQFNPFQQLSLAPTLEGGLGINIDKLVLPDGMSATDVGQAILDAIAQAQQNQQYKLTAQGA